jgi:hypothetical protein
MKNLLITIVAAVAIAWIAVPVAGADVYSHPKPHADVYSSTWTRVHSQGLPWDGLRFHLTADVNERG